MIIEAVNYKAIWEWVNQIWARSLVAVLLFFLGLWIGIVQTEGRIASDCKFAGSFRVDIQAFICQRKL